jgi:hypothetical protein
MSPHPSSIPYAVEITGTPMTWRLPDFVMATTSNRLLRAALGMDVLASKELRVDTGVHPPRAPFMVLAVVDAFGKGGGFAESAGGPAESAAAQKGAVVHVRLKQASSPPTAYYPQLLGSPAGNAGAAASM